MAVSSKKVLSTYTVPYNAITVVADSYYCLLMHDMCRHHHWAHKLHAARIIREQCEYPDVYSLLVDTYTYKNL